MKAPLWPLLFYQCHPKIATINVIVFAALISCGIINYLLQYVELFIYYSEWILQKIKFLFKTNISWFSWLANNMLFTIILTSILCFFKVLILLVSSWYTIILLCLLIIPWVKSWKWSFVFLKEDKCLVFKLFF